MEKIIILLLKKYINFGLKMILRDFFLFRLVIDVIFKIYILFIIVSLI